MLLHVLPGHAAPDPFHGCPLYAELGSDHSAPHILGTQAADFPHSVVGKLRVWMLAAASPAFIARPITTRLSSCRHHVRDVPLWRGVFQVVEMIVRRAVVFVMDIPAIGSTKERRCNEPMNKASFGLPVPTQTHPQIPVPLWLGFQAPTSTPGFRGNGTAHVARIAHFVGGPIGDRAPDNARGIGGRLGNSHDIFSLIENGVVRAGEMLAHLVGPFLLYCTNRSITSRVCS